MICSVATFAPIFASDPVSDATPLESNLQAAQTQALASRPELREARLQIKQAEFNRRVTKSSYIPDVSFSCSQYFTHQCPASAFERGIRWRSRFLGSAGLGAPPPSACGKFQADRTGPGPSASETEAQVLIDVNSKFRKLKESRLLLNAAEIARDAQKENLRVVMNEFEQKAASAQGCPSGAVFAFRRGSPVSASSAQFLDSQGQLRKGPRRGISDAEISEAKQSEFSTVSPPLARHGRAGLRFRLRPQEDLSKSPTPVRLSPVVANLMSGGVRYSANIEPNAQISLAFKSGGYVVTIYSAQGFGRPDAQRAIRRRRDEGRGSRPSSSHGLHQPSQRGEGPVRAGAGFL